MADEVLGRAPSGRRRRPPAGAVGRLPPRGDGRPPPRRAALFDFQVQLQKDEALDARRGPDGRLARVRRRRPRTVARINIPAQEFRSTAQMASARTCRSPPGTRSPSTGPWAGSTGSGRTSTPSFPAMRHDRERTTAASPNPATRPSARPLAPGPATFDGVLCGELGLIRARGGRWPGGGAGRDRDAAGRPRMSTSGLTAARLAVLDEHVTGLAFSGGGIRSGTFAVGFLQGLATLGLLRRFDYLSTVSGGGYAGGWLAAWLKRDGDAGDVERPARRRSRVAESRAEPRSSPDEPGRRRGARAAPPPAGVQQLPVPAAGSAVGRHLDGDPDLAAERPDQPDDAPAAGDAPGRGLARLVVSLYGLINPDRRSATARARVRRRWPFLGGLGRPASRLAFFSNADALGEFRGARGRRRRDGRAGRSRRVFTVGRLAPALVAAVLADGLVPLRPAGLRIWFDRPSARVNRPAASESGLVGGGVRAFALGLLAALDGLLGSACVHTWSAVVLRTASVRRRDPGGRRCSRLDPAARRLRVPSPRFAGLRRSWPGRPAACCSSCWRR